MPDWIEDERQSRSKWEARKRLELIEFLLYWEQRVKAADIGGYFGVSDTQAFNDIETYRRLTLRVTEGGEVVGNLEPRVEGKRPGFVKATEDMVCRFIVPEFDHYARFFIEDAQTSWTPVEGFSLSRPQLKFITVPTLDRRPVEAGSARAILRAIINRMDVEADYLSPAYGSPKTVRFSPTALGFDGFRWHVRAYRHDQATRRQDGSAYRDMVLERIGRARAVERTQIVPSDPGAKPCQVEVVPNPSLPLHQQDNVAAQYPDMRDRVWAKTMPRSLVPYFLKRYQIEESSLRKAPHQEPLVLKNREAVTQALDEGWRVPPHHPTDPLEPLLKQARPLRPGVSDVDIVADALQALIKGSGGS